ncbi:MAG: hypothetical protein PHF00_08530 [Elusimicrobia bacterium]|nr:hypothetical protein [Elusimicrobiota bacterium]
MLSWECRSAGSRSDLLFWAMRRRLLNRAPGGDAEFLALVRRVWESSAALAPGREDHEVVRARALAWESKAGFPLITAARVLAGDWNVGAYSVRQGGCLHVVCGCAGMAASVLNHELAHYYLRLWLPRRLAGSEWEERLVQFLTGWHLGARELEAHQPALERARGALERAPFCPRAFCETCEALA